MTAKARKQSSAGYAADFINRLVGLYLEILEETDAEAARLIAQKAALQEQGGDKPGSEEKRRAAKHKRMRAYIDFWQNLDEDKQLKLAAQDAKINHLSRVARIMATTQIVQAHNALEPNTAGSIHFVLNRFREADMTARQVQQFIDENASAWFSLTGHPTNPATVAYTKAQNDVAKILADEQATAADLEQALRTLRDTPIVGERKTPLQEAEETLNTLDVVYDTALAQKRLFEAALEQSGFRKKGVKITRPLLRPCVWTLGDGDGNASMTAQVLEDGIALHRSRIAARYGRTCEDILQAAQTAGIDEKIQQEIDRLAGQISRRGEKPAKPAEHYAQRAEAIAAKISKTKTARRLEDFAYLIRCFGLGFGTIDIRHNAVDIMATVECLFHAGKLLDKDRFGALSLDEKGVKISAWLKDENALEALAMITPEDLRQDATARRIYERLQVIGRNPDMCEKLIIAETSHSAHALAALLLLRVTGNEIGNDKSRIDLTVLSESVSDLVTLGNMLEVLLINETFRQHVVSRKRFVVMIAKSDTTRQDGRGEAEYAQYEAAVDAYHIVGRLKQKYPELEPVLVSIMNGGGHALQRGGGRVTEIPAVHGRAAADARVTDIGPSTLTIQGQQQGILLCPGATALGTLEALAAQNLYSKAGILGEMPYPEFSKNRNKQYARADAWLYARKAGEAFDRLTKKNPAIDELLVAAPWLAMKAGNVSSRPAKRGEKQVGPGVTPAEAKTANPRALAGRAISGERLTAHACLPVFSVLGLLEAMEAVRTEGMACMNPKKYGDALHHLYRAHKLYRDAARATVNAARMADFDIAWPLLTGKTRPSGAQVEKLAKRFIHTPEPGTNPPEVTLAFLELYFLEVEKLTFEMVSGHKPKASMHHGDALRKLWPDLSAQVERRDRNAEFARVIECYRTRYLDENEPNTPLSETAFRITQALYTSANVVNAPVGILATRTRLEPVYEVSDTGKTRFMRPGSYREKQVQHLLQLPKALQ